MDEHADTRGHDARSETDTIIHWQTVLAKRVLLIFTLPLLVIVVLGAYAYRLSGRVETLEALEQISFIERLMQKSHSHEWAIREYQQLAEAYAHPHVFVRLGALYFERGAPQDQERAMDMLARAKAIDPDYWETYSTAAYLYLQQHNVEKAIEAGEKALALNPFDAQTYNNLAWLYATDTEVLNLPKAQEYALKAVAYTRRLEPDYLDTLVEVYTQTGQINRASNIIQDAIARNVVDAQYFKARLAQLHTPVTNE